MSAWFDGDGCCISQASASMLMEKIEGLTVEELKQFTAQDMLELFGARLTPNRQKCCLLSWRVVQAAVHAPLDRARREWTAGTDPIAQSGRTSTLPEENAVVALNGSSPLDPHDVPCGFPDSRRPWSTATNRWCTSTTRPRRNVRSQVIQTLVEAYERHYANVHRGIHWLSEQSTDLYEESRESVRRFIQAAHRHEVIFTTGATAAINLVARSWGDRFVRPGDEIVLTEMEHHSNIVPVAAAGRTHRVHDPVRTDYRRRIPGPRGARTRCSTNARGWWR